MSHEFSLFYKELADVQNLIVQDKETIHRITHVLRMQPGETIILFNQKFHAFFLLQKIESKKITGILNDFQLNNILNPHLKLFLPVLKKEALSEAVYGAVECGVSEIQLVITEKVQRKWQGEKEIERLKRVIIAAAEQSKYFAFPAIYEPLSFLDVLRNPGVDNLLCADPEGKTLVKKVTTGSCGIFLGPEFNAVLQAHTPFFNKLLELYPWAVLKAAGLSVGLPEDAVGNSEVGHLTIGAGSVILQPFTIIQLAIKDGSFFRNSILKENLDTLKKSGNTLHLIGLISDAGVHAHIEHLFAFLKAAQNAGLTDVVIHPILDGRDSPPQSAGAFLQAVEDECKKLGIGRIGTIHGRFFAMDRNEATQVTKESFNILTKKKTGNLC